MIPAAYAQRYLDRVKRLLDTLDPEAIGALIEALLVARANGATVWLLGNGGSAATAQHFASDLLTSVRLAERPFRAICLSDNVAALTAIANDYGYSEVFARQLTGRVAPGDLVVAISASGSSENVLAAARVARAAGAQVAALTGFDGGQLRSLAHLHVHVGSAPGEYGPTEDLHMVVKHLVSTYLCATLNDDADPRTRSVPG